MNRGFLFVGLLLLLPACGEMPEAGPVPELEGAVALRLERNTRELVLPAGIDGRGPFALVLDSGLSGTHLLSSDAAERLDLDLTGIAIGASWGGPRLARFARLDRLELGPLTLPGVPVAVMDLPAGVTQRAGRADIAGLLGGPLFQAYAVTVDVPAGTVTLAMPGGVPEPGGAELPLTVDALATVAVAIDGRAVRLAVDTGATSDITLTEAAASRIGLPERYGPGRRAEVYSAAGPVGVAKRAVETVDLGGITMARVEVDVVDAGLLGDGLPDGVDGVLGLGLLTQFRFTIDFAAGRLGLVPLAGHDLEFWEEMERSGFRP